MVLSAFFGRDFSVDVYISSSSSSLDCISIDYRYRYCHHLMVTSCACHLLLLRVTLRLLLLFLCFVEYTLEGLSFVLYYCGLISLELFGAVSWRLELSLP